MIIHRRPANDGTPRFYWRIIGVHTSFSAIRFCHNARDAFNTALATRKPAAP